MPRVVETLEDRKTVKRLAKEAVADLMRRRGTKLSKKELAEQERKARKQTKDALRKAKKGKMADQRKSRAAKRAADRLTKDRMREAAGKGAKVGGRWKTPPKESRDHRTPKDQRGDEGPPTGALDRFRGKGKRKAPAETRRLDRDALKLQPGQRPLSYTEADLVSLESHSPGLVRSIRETKKLIRKKRKQR